MQLTDLLIDLRRNILSVISAVKNANGIFSWDTTTPNSTTRSQLQDLLQQTRSAAETFGIYRVVRHSSCGLVAHDGNVIEQGPHGISEFNDRAFKWSRCQLYQGDRTSSCPCTAGAKPTKHSVIHELVVRRQGATAQHERLAEALWDVQQAIDKAGDKKTRSAIREHLLRAVINLNDGILPKSVDDYIASRVDQD